MLICLLTNLAMAQSNASDAAVEGYVFDPSGAAVAAAKVSLQDPSTKLRVETTSDGEGHFQFPIVRVGEYTMQVSAPGFSDYVHTGLSLRVGERARVDADLQVGATGQTVEVSGSASIDDMGVATVGSVLERDEVESLPVVSRNVYNYHLLAPGVRGIPSFNFATTQLIFGANERANWTLDGLDNTRRGQNPQLHMMIVSPDAVEQMQVLSNGASAEFGRAAGGQVNVVLRSGSNEFHGSGAFYYRPDDIQARPSLAATAPPRSWRSESFTLGGPLVKDKLFFFLSAELNPYTLPKAITISATNAAALGLPPSQTGNSPYGEDYHTLLGKIDYKLNSRNFGYVRYNRFTNHQPDNASGLIIPSRGNNYDELQNAGGVQLASVLTPNLVNELRGGVIERFTQNAPIGPPDPNGAFINITGVANIGYDPLAKTNTTEQSGQLTDNITLTRGRNTWKAGVDYQHTSLNILTAQNRAFTFGGLAAAGLRPAVSALNQYLYTLQGLIDPSTGKPYTYTLFQVDGGDPRIALGFNFVNWFLQDEIRISPSLSLNAGVRYEVLLIPTLDANAPYALSRKVDNDLNNFAPRLAVTWSPGSKRTVLRAGFGMYYDVPGLNIFTSAAQVNGDRFLSYQIAGTAANAPVFPTIPSITGASYLVAPNITAFNPHFQDAYQIQSNFQIDRQLSPGLQLTAGYEYAGFRHAMYPVNTNLGAAVSFLADGRPVFGGPRPNPQFNQINTYEYDGNSNFSGLSVNLTKRLSSGLEFSAAWLYSHSLADTLGEGAAPEDPTNIHRDYGNADTDMRHSFNFQSLYRFSSRQAAWRWVNGFELSSLLNFNSGMPVNVVSGIDLDKDGVLNDRPLFAGRNSVTGPSFLVINGRISRTFAIRENLRLSAEFEAENLLNHTNPNCSTSTGCSAAVVNTATASDFGRLINAATARNVQFGVRFTF